MSNDTASEDIVGIVAGTIGYVLSKFSLGIKLVALSGFLPEIHAVIASIITAMLCAMVGFVTTRICHSIFKRFKFYLNEKFTKKL